MTKEDEYKNWFNRLFSGTTASGNQKLYGKTDKHSLVKIFHPGYYQRWTGGMTSGMTEWYVFENLSPTDGYGHAKHEWKKEGRLLKEDKEYIIKTFGIKYEKQD